jgi:hypothetical protein
VASVSDERCFWSFAVGEPRGGSIEGKAYDQDPRIGPQGYIPKHDPNDPRQADPFEPNLPKRAENEQTSAFFTHNGQKMFLKSQLEGPGKIFYNPDRSNVEQAALHVEGHAAGYMLKNNLKEMTITINNRMGPCRTCREQVAEMLLPGRKLNVNWTDRHRNRWTTVFEGGKGWETIPWKNPVQ